MPTHTFSKGVLTKVNDEPPEQKKEEKQPEKPQPKKKEEARGKDAPSS